jgi:cytochrome P450
VTAVSSAIESNIDPYSDEALLNPWPGYKVLRDLGPVTLLKKYGMFAFTRYDKVLSALLDWQNFSSAGGVMMNEEMNRAQTGNTLCSDGQEHEKLRNIIGKPLTAGALKSLRDDIFREATELVDRLLSRDRFDAVTDLAQYLPKKIVSTAVGLPEAGRERMLVWAEQMFNCFGPSDNPRTKIGFPVFDEMMEYAKTQATRGKLVAGSWAEAILDAADRGDVGRDLCPVLMLDYMGPSLDTTIFGITNGVWLFANNPEQWELVRNDPTRIPGAINEILRMESPIQDFSRLLVKDYDCDGIKLPAGARVIMFYGAANRDERKFADPDRFDVRRAAVNLSFGAGPHMCAGQNLARLEMRAIFTALAARVKSFHIESEVRVVHNVLRGFRSLVVSVDQSPPASPRHQCRGVHGSPPPRSALPRSWKP